MNTLAKIDLSGVSDVMNSISSLGGIGKYLVAILIFFIGKFVAKLIAKLIEKALGKTNLDDKLSSVVGGNTANSEKVVSQFFYYIILLFVIIAALNAAGLTEVTDVLKGMLDKILGVVPNILGAGIVLFLATVLAKIVKTLLGNVLTATRIDQRIGSPAGKTPITDAISIVGYCLILLLFLPVAFGILDMPEISEPIGSISDQVLGSIPNILIAGVLIAAGAFIAQIVQKLIVNLLKAAQVDAFPAKMGLDLPADGKGSLSSVAGLVVFISILVFFVSIAINTLDIELLSVASEGILGGYFNILLAIIIFGAGFIASKFAFKNLADKNLILAKVVRGLIIFITSIVALQRSGIAPELTGLPFQGLIAAITFAIGVGGAIALGLGAKDYVSRTLEKRG